MIQCAVKRRTSPAGASPARQLSLQPVAIGAVGGGNEPRSLWCRGSPGDLASMQAVTRVNAEQASKRVMRKPTRLNIGEGRSCWGERAMRPQQVRRGNGDGM